MKKLYNDEMKAIKGGVIFVQTSGVCEGFDNNLHNWHSVTIKGKGITNQEMKADFNANLRKHKTSAYYVNFSHSLEPQ